MKKYILVWRCHFVLCTFLIVIEDCHVVMVDLLSSSGVLLGWLCVPYQHHPPTCAYPHDHWPLLSPCVCCLLYTICHWHHPLHADLLCWVPACLHLRTHGGESLPLCWSYPYRFHLVFLHFISHPMIMSFNHIKLTVLFQDFIVFWKHQFFTFLIPCILREINQKMY